MTYPRAFMPSQSGAAASEMALVLPLLLAIMFGGFEAGHYFYTEHKIIKAVREGARYAGRLGFTGAGYSCQTAGGPTTWTAAGNPSLSNTRAVTVYGSTDTSGNPRIANWALTDVTVEYQCNSAFTGGIYSAQVSGGPVVRVTATASDPSLFNQLGFIDGSAKVNASAQAPVNGI